MNLNHSLTMYGNTTENTSNIYGDSFTTWLIVSLAVCTLGTTSYAILLITIYSEKSLRTGAGLLLLHLILAEAVLAIVHFSLMLADVFLAETRALSNDSFCYYMMFSYWTTLFASNWSAAFLSFNRLLAVCKPHFYRRSCGKVARNMMFLGSWMLGLGITLPVGLGVGGRFDAMPELGRLCGVVRTGLRPKEMHVYDGVTTMGMYLPLALTLIVYIGLFTVTKSSTDGRKPSIHAQNPNTKHAGRSTVRQRLTMARMLFVASIWYCICFCPIPVVMAVFLEPVSKCPVTILWLRTLLFTGFSTKPVLYYFLSADYRDGLQKVCRRLRQLSRAGPFHTVRPSVSKPEHLSNANAVNG